MKAFNFAALLVVAFLASSSGQANAGKKKSTDAEPATAPALADDSTAKPEVRKTYDGPFGLAMGISVAELQGDYGFKRDRKKLGYFEGQPPKPVNGMDSYFAVATKGQGVCKIGATVIVEITNDFGDQIKAEADRVAELVQLKYGKYTEKVDYIKDDDHKGRSDFWTYDLEKQLNAYSYHWGGGKKGIALPNNIKSIEVASVATALSKGYILVSYEFNNFGDCLTEIKKQNSSNL